MTPWLGNRDDVGSATYVRAGSGLPCIHEGTYVRSGVTGTGLPCIHVQPCERLALPGLDIVSTSTYVRKYASQLALRTYGQWQCYVRTHWQRIALH